MLLSRDINAMSSFQQKSSINQSSHLTKKQLKQMFNQIINIHNNANCFQCKRKTKHWIQLNHCIFLCMTCACNYRQLHQIADVRNIQQECQKQKLSSQQMRKIKRHGNKQFYDFMKSYDLHQEGYQIKIKSKAAAYYRKSIKQQLNGKVIQSKPQLEEGQQIYSINNDIFMFSDKNKIGTFQKFGSNIKKNAASVKEFITSKASSLFKGKSKKDARKLIENEKYEQTFKMKEQQSSKNKKKDFFTLHIDSSQKMEQKQTELNKAIK